MKLIRNDIFETNSSSTHSLVVKKIPSKLPKRHYKKNWQGRVMDITRDDPNFRVVCGEFYGKSKHTKMKVPDYNGEKLTNPEINASYLFTWLQIRYFNSYKIDEPKEVENLAKTTELLAKFHELMLDLDLKPEYLLPTIKYDPYDYNYDGGYEDTPKIIPYWELQDTYMEYNDGGFIESFKDIENILKSKKTLENYLTKHKIKMVYCG